MANVKADDNFRPGLLAETDDAARTPTPLKADPTTKRLKVDQAALLKTIDSIQIWLNTVKDGSGTDYIPLIDSDGHLQIDVLSSIEKPFTTLIDDFTTANKTYIGKAVAGANEGALVWQIKCLDETGNFLKIGFADGVSTFTKEWDNRVGYSYS